jgi:hypothetical protein
VTAGRGTQLRPALMEAASRKGRRQENVRYGRVLLVLLACLSSLSLAGCFGGGGPSDLTKTFNLTGKVTSVGTGHPVTAHPVPGALVEVGQSRTFTSESSSGGY